MEDKKSGKGDCPRKPDDSSPPIPSEMKLDDYCMICKELKAKANMLFHRSGRAFCGECIEKRSLDTSKRRPRTTICGTNK